MTDLAGKRQRHTSAEEESTPLLAVPSDESVEGNVQQRNSWEHLDVPWYRSRRYFLSLWAFLGFFNVYALRVNLSVAIVKMSTHYGWGNAETTLVLSSFFYGYICTQLPGGWLATLFGGKYVFGIGVLCTTLLTLLTPLASEKIGWLIALRVVEGLGEGVTYPAMHAMWAKWAPPQERSRLATIGYIGAYMGTIISLPVSGALASSHFLHGWPSVFYVFGILGLLWFILWMFVASNSPDEHRGIDPGEREYIKRSIAAVQGNERKGAPPVPWGDIITNLPVWGIIICHFTNNWGFYTLLTCLPTYFNDVLHFNISSGGIYASLPYISLFLIALGSGQLADHLRKKTLSTTTVRKLFNTVAYVLSSAFLILCGYVDTFHFSGDAGRNSHMMNAIAVVFLTIANGVLGFAMVGYNINHLDVSPRFAGVLMGITNGIATIPGFVGPIVAGTIAKCVYCDDEKSAFYGSYWEGKQKCPPSQEDYQQHICHQEDAAHQWRIVFLISAGLNIFGALAFLLLASGKVQKFNNIDSTNVLHVVADINSDGAVVVYSSEDGATGADGSAQEEHGSRRAQN